MAVSYKSTSIKSTNVRFYGDIGNRLSYAIFSVIWFFSEPLAKFLVKYLFFRPQKYAISADQKAFLEKAVPFTFMSGKKKIQAYKWGQGPAILFVHGWAGQGVQFMPFFKPVLASGCSVVTFDHVGHGASDGMFANYFEFSKAVYNLIVNHRDLDIKAVVAHSLGGSAVVNFLSRTRLNIKVILIAPALSLIDTLNTTFIKYGVPLHIFKSLLKDLEQETGHEFAKENPVDLIQDITSDIYLVHDFKDKAISFEESRKVSLRQDNISLYPKYGLGHIRILKDDSVVNDVVKTINSRATPIFYY